MRASQPSPYSIRLSYSTLELLEEVAQRNNVSGYALARKVLEDYLKLSSCDRTAA
jgi:hypothetical protein